MKPFAQFPEDDKKKIRFVLTDIDDTLTNKGRLSSLSLAAMERLQENGIRVIPITGRPAGWCDHMARMWPVDGLIGENGAFYFRYDNRNKKMTRRYWKTEDQRNQDRQRLETIKQEILDKVSGCQVASDQAYREADLAIDFCEDVTPLPMSTVQEIVRCFIIAGARAKISSIHVNGWFGDYDKLAMTHVFFKEEFRSDLETIKDHVIFVGDSPNDAPMFQYFPHSVGVANISQFIEKIDYRPVWITKHEGGYGFAEMTDQLLS
ncbi:MAG: HAD-IIB family hydrolase [Desulfobacterales bacterium]|nr:MAG: HAD-IIB family hydrolase [Desulfobacterales bacterium]